jgi:hypothetical protein
VDLDMRANGVNMIIVIQLSDEKPLIINMPYTVGSGEM